MATNRATIVAPGESTASSSNYNDYVNPQWVSLLNLLGMNVDYERCLACELFTKDGRCVLDFLSGYCIHNTGHNHPYIILALKDEMDRCGSAMLQCHAPEIAGELSLCELAGGELEKACFGSSGSESVEAAIKFARATTPRRNCLCAKQFSWTDHRTAMFGRIVVMRMFREKGILTQICGNNFMVLKAAPPLMVTSEQLDEFVVAIRDVVEMAQTSLAFWTEALAIVRRAVNIEVKKLGRP